jgi:carboxylesterase
MTATNTSNTSTPQAQMTRLPDIMAGARPHFHRGNEVGCLVVHGFMATPAEVGWLGDALAEVGYTVYVPRLTGHGFMPEDMVRMRWHDWYAQVLDAYYVLKQQCERIYVIGHSMGGLLGTLLASEHEIDALVVTASPFTVANRVMPFAKWIKFVLPFTQQPTEDALQREILKEQRRRGEFESGRVNYSKWASSAVAELNTLVHKGRACLPAIRGHVLLLYAENDNAVRLSDMQLFEDEAPQATIERYTLKEGGHIIYQDVARDEAFSVVLDYVERLEANS